MYLSGPMIFGVAKAIARQREAVQNCLVMILDLSEVPHLGVTTSLSIENAIQEAVDGEREVFIVGATGQTYKRLTRLGLLQIVPEENFLSDRTEALRRAVDAVQTKSVAAAEPGLPEPPPSLPVGEGI